MEKLDAFTRYLGNCGLFHFFDGFWYSPVLLSLF